MCVYIYIYITTTARGLPCPGSSPWWTRASSSPRGTSPHECAFRPDGAAMNAIDACYHLHVQYNVERGYRYVVCR